MDKIVVITGGSSGLGKKLLKLFTASGDIVCCLSRSNTENYINHFFCDVKDEESVKTAISSAMEKYGRIDILICNSGVGIAGATEILPSEKIKEVMDINFYGAFYTIKYGLKYMKAGGKIINISSAAALFALPFRSIYSASKSALNMMSFGLNMELAPQNITSTAICPGEIQTEFVKNRIQYFGNDKYSSKVKSISEEFIKKQDKRMPADYAAAKIFKIINKIKIKPFYIIGTKYKFFYFISKILPTAFFLKITGKKYGGKETK